MRGGGPFWAESGDLGLTDEGVLWRVLRDAQGEYAGVERVGPVGDGATSWEVTEAEWASFAVLLATWDDRDRAGELEAEAREHYERGLR